MENRLIARGGGGSSEMDEEGQKVQTSIYKINKSWLSNVQHGDCYVNVMLILYCIYESC